MGPGPPSFFHMSPPLALHYTSQTAPDAHSRWIRMCKGEHRGATAIYVHRHTVLVWIKGLIWLGSCHGSSWDETFKALPSFVQSLARWDTLTAVSLVIKTAESIIGLRMELGVQPTLGKTLVGEKKITALCNELAGALLLKWLLPRWGPGMHPFSQSPAFNKLLVICVCQSVCQWLQSVQDGPQLFGDRSPNTRQHQASLTSVRPPIADFY